MKICKYLEMYEERVYKKSILEYIKNRKYKICTMYKNVYRRKIRFFLF